MPDTLNLPKTELVARALEQMKTELADGEWTTREKLALTCRILFDGGHDSGLAGQITARTGQGDTFYTQALGPPICSSSTRT